MCRGKSQFSNRNLLRRHQLQAKRQKLLPLLCAEGNVVQRVTPAMKGGIDFKVSSKIYFLDAFLHSITHS